MVVYSVGITGYQSYKLDLAVLFSEYESSPAAFVSMSR